MPSDIVSVIGKYVRLWKSGNNLIGRCPFHAHERNSLSVSPSKGMWYCFECRKGGDALEFLKRVRHLSFPKAVEALMRMR